MIRIYFYEREPSKYYKLTIQTYTEIHLISESLDVKESPTQIRWWINSQSQPVIDQYCTTGINGPSGTGGTGDTDGMDTKELYL